MSADGSLRSRSILEFGVGPEVTMENFSDNMVMDLSNTNEGTPRKGTEQDYCRLIIAVMGFEKMVNSAGASTVRVVAGDHQIRVDGAYRASVVVRLHSLLESRNLEVLGIDQSSDPDRFALLMHVKCPMSQIANFTALRDDLEKSAKELGVALKVQREELFAYMHRI